jgi:2,4-dienoyl-CoA reductase-like NADH-dependent reductase (Old Yellow Enzyme family)
VSDASILFQPTTIGPLTLRNRLAVAPMTRVSATDDGCATPQMAEYYSRFAKGGFAMIIVEATYVDEQRSQGYLFQPGLANDRHLEAWKQVVDAIHAGGALAVMQFVHGGALNQGRNSAYPQDAIAPSAVKPKGTKLTFYRGEGEYDVPREITREEIAEVKGAFASASVRALEAGFDAIEVHGANGYLLDQFWTAYTNERTDEYGGSARNRIRLDEEIIREAIAATGNRIPIGLRLSQSKVNDFEYQWVGGEQDAADIFPVLDDAGVAFIHITEHDATTEVFGTGHSLSGLAKRHAKAPVIVNGGLGDPAKAAGVIAHGDADVIAQGKSALANPDWPAKVEAGAELEEFDFGMFNPLADLASQAAWEAAR